MSLATYTPTGHLILTADPAVEQSRLGDVYFNSSLNALRVYCLSAYGGGDFDADQFAVTPVWQTLMTEVALSTKVNALNAVTGLWAGSQAEYNAIAVPDPTVIYVIN